MKKEEIENFASSFLGAQRSSWLTKSKLNFFPTKGNFEIAAKTKTKNNIAIPITHYFHVKLHCPACKI